MAGPLKTAMGKEQRLAKLRFPVRDICRDRNARERRQPFQQCRIESQWPQDQAWLDHERPNCSARR